MARRKLLKERPEISQTQTNKQQKHFMSLCSLLEYKNGLEIRCFKFVKTSLWMLLSETYGHYALKSATNLDTLFILDQNAYGLHSLRYKSIQNP